MQTIGDRLKSERERLGLSQKEICELTGVSRKTQFNYENGDRHPDAAYLALLLGRGGNVEFILSGQRQRESRPDKSELNGELLENSIERLDLMLKSMCYELSSAKKARIVTLLYRTMATQQHVDSAMIQEWIELAV